MNNSILVISSSAHYLSYYNMIYSILIGYCDYHWPLLIPNLLVIIVSATEVIKTLILFDFIFINSTSVILWTRCIYIHTTTVIVTLIVSPIHISPKGWSYLPLLNLPSVWLLYRSSCLLPAARLCWVLEEMRPLALCCSARHFSVIE